jgi:hypothetical protein
VSTQNFAKHTSFFIYHFVFFKVIFLFKVSSYFVVDMEVYRKYGLTVQRGRMLPT